MTLARLTATLACCALAACGGNSGNAALTKTFNYGSPSAPSSQEQSAVDTAQTTLSSSTSIAASPDANKGLAIASFAETVSSLALGNATLGARPPTSHEIVRAFQNADITACAVQTANSITFKACSTSESGFNFNLDGSISWTATSVNWDINGSFSGSSNGVTVSANLHQAGGFANLTGSEVKGNATAEVAAQASGNGQSASVGVSQATVLDLTYQTAPNFCITGGPLEVKRVWTQLPQGASGAAFTNAGVKFTWSACGTVQVAHST